MSARIGIDLGGTKISGIVLGADGAIRARQRRPSPRDDYRATLAAVADLVTELETAAGLEPGAAGVGIGTPGTWQPRLERMKNCNSTWLNGRPLLHDLVAALGARVRVANDADCFAVSEAADGAGTGAATVFGVVLGTGVGGGVVVNGALLGGRNGLAGEWGHTPLPYFRCRAFVGERLAAGAASDLDRLESALQDRLCYCGRVNCIETFLSGPGLAGTHLELWGESLSAEAIAGGHDARAVQTLALYQHMLARSLAQVVNVLDPEVIVLGGGVSNVSGLYSMQERLVPAYAFSSEADDVRVAVRRARWGDDSGVRGAARLW